jgi:hypothetical protein
MIMLNLLTGQLGIPTWALCILGIVIVWSTIWKAIALWKSARDNSPVWFIVLLLANTVGILEILYIYVFSKMKFEKPKVRRKKR